MTDLAIFAFESAAVRTLDLNGEPWFVATDISKILGFKEAKDMTRMLDDDEKGRHNVPTLGGDQEAIIINESGLYACILKSRRPEAKAFRKWVTSEVLPSIRKQGSYAAPGALPPRQFVTSNLSHGADLAVAADRTFRGFLRSARAAGLRLPQALRVANRQTMARTGLDMLAELEVDVTEIASHAALPEPAASGQVEAFIESWLDGQLPVPAVVCRSSDLYAAYRQYATENAVACVATAPNFCAAARRYERDLIFKMLHLSTGPGSRISARGVIPPALLLGIPEGQIGVTNARMVAEFSAALQAWLLRSTG